MLDPARLEDALGRLIEAANREGEARDRPPLVWSQEEAGGRLYRRLATAGGQVLFDAGIHGLLYAMTRQKVATGRMQPWERLPHITHT